MTYKTKPVFKRKAKPMASTPINTTFGSEQFKVVSTQSKLTEMEMLISEWCIKYPPSMSPQRFLREIKEFADNKVAAYMRAAPASLWFEKRREYQNMITKDMVKSQLDFVTEMNDQHIKASRLGLAKAIEMLTKMEIKPYLDKHGDTKFSKFRTADLKNCLESIAIAQKIQRTALGLPSDEGAITVWQQLNVNQPQIAQTNIQINDGETASVAQLEKLLSYDDIRNLIEAQRQGLLPAGGDTITLGAEGVQDGDLGV